MTIEEIYSEINAHMIKGLMFHSQMADYYRFLGLNGSAKMHEVHYMREARIHRKMNADYICHHNSLIRESRVDNPNVVPETWYGRSRMDVDANTKAIAVKNAAQKWVDWEKSTVDLYKSLSMDLRNLGETEDAIHLEHLLVDVSEELNDANSHLLGLKSVEYDMIYVVDLQSTLIEEYCD